MLAVTPAGSALEVALSRIEMDRAERGCAVPRAPRGGPSAPHPWSVLGTLCWGQALSPQNLCSPRWRTLPFPCRLGPSHGSDCQELREVLSADFLCLGLTSSVLTALGLFPSSVTRTPLVSLSVSLRAPVCLFISISVTRPLVCSAHTRVHTNTF